MSPSDRIFCAVDTPDLDRARAIAAAVKGSVGGLKLGLEFYSALGPDGIRKVSDLGVPIFLDLKFHDIPNTVAKAIKAVSPLAPKMITIHTGGGLKMMKAAKAAYDAGARWVVLCDTNGGALPHDVRAGTKALIEAGVPGDHIGIHTHNDTENAIANSLVAVAAGARQVQGTLNGLGERCGNANLTTLIPTLLLKEPYASQFETGVSMEALKGLRKASRMLDEILNQQCRFFHSR